jgi:polyhydroxybutyrate depolymerase
MGQRIERAVCAWPISVAVLVALLAGTQSVAGYAAEPLASGAPPAVPGETTASAACVGMASGDQTLTVVADGTTRTVLVHVPEAATPAKPMPALIALHGYSAEAADFAQISQLPAIADEAGFIVAFPQGLGAPPYWNLVGVDPSVADPARPDRDFVTAVIDLLTASGCVNPARIFLVGHSMGGGMTGDLACQIGDRIAGIGLMSAMALHPPCQPPRPLPVFVSHAMDDIVLPYLGGQIQGAPDDYPKQLPVEDTVRGWAMEEGCTPGNDLTVAAAVEVELTFVGCAAPVEFDRRSTGGHEWSVSAGGEMVRFLLSLPQS